MNAIYDFLTGPLLWIALLVFVCGSVAKVAMWISKARSSDPFVFKYWSWKYALRSLVHWTIPFNTMRWRTKPVLTVFTTVFHLGVILIPIFLLAHVVLWEQYMGVTWITLPEGLADVLAVLTLAGCGYFAYRRIFDKQVAFVTRGEDWLILAIVTGTFLFGFLAGQQWGPYMAWLNLHVLFGEAFLIMIPFTRVKHMLLYPLTRGYIGSEFGAVRKTRDY